jgi:Methane oxygenase PmoA
VELFWESTAVARYDVEPDLPADVSPRPYLHPVRTLGGREVTAFMPPDHRHHFGVNVAIPDAGGHNFWGGRTFVRDQGPTWLPNHGRQRHVEWADDGTQVISWLGADGAEVFREERVLRAAGVDGGWALDFRFALTNVTGATIEIGSPATHGRPGAGYGGFFWRLSGGPGEVRPFGPAGDGEHGVHGRRAPWVAMAGPGWTLVFVSDDGDPWFVRAAEYPGVGSSLAWDTPLAVPPGGVVARRVVTAIVDGPVSPDRAAALASGCVGIPTP